MANFLTDPEESGFLVHLVREWRHTPLSMEDRVLRDILAAFRTNSVRKSGIRMCLDIAFNLLPVTFIVANLLAVSANGQET